MSQSILPAERAFVVHFDAGDTCAGRVEHVVSGRGAWFSTRDELSRFVRDALQTVDAASEGGDR